MRRDGTILKEVPLIEIDNVVILGNATLSAPLIQLLLDARVPVSYLSWSGRFYGRLQPRWAKNALVRLAQYRAAQDANSSLEIARAIVAGKIANGRARLQRLRRELASSSSPLLDESIATLHSIGRTLGSVTSLDQLRGAEGLAARVYFHAFTACFRRPGFPFERRTRRPPRDPVNALLSFSYALLQTHVDAAVNLVGLDPYVGYLHGLKHGKPALVLDLMEEFRPVVADGVVAAVINHGTIRPEHFVYRFGSVELSESAREAFLTAFEQRIRSDLCHPVFGYQVSYRRCIELQVRILAKALLGEIPGYRPLRVR